MEIRTDSALAGVPRHLEAWKTRQDWRGALLARAVLADSCEALLRGAEKESRGLTGDEQRAFDEHAAQVREINEQLAAFKRLAVADVMAQGLPADHCRLPF